MRRNLSLRSCLMKYLILTLFLSACSHKSTTSENEINIFCQNLNILYQRIDVISSNIANAQTTRTAAGGPYIRKLAQNCKNGFCDIVEDKDPTFLRYKPKHPDANKNGYVVYPNINLRKEESDRLFWNRVFETVYANAPVPSNFFFKDKRAVACFEKFPALKSNLD